MVNVSYSRIKLVREHQAEYNIDRLIGSPEAAAKVIQTVFDLEHEAQEVFGSIFVNTKNKMLGIQEMGRGSISAAFVDVREVFKSALLHNASGIIVFHNHPSGDPLASSDDLKATEELVKAGKIMNIVILDHIILGEDGKFSSLKEDGVI